MITLCSVIYGPNNRYLEYFKESLIKKCKYVSEIVFCNLDHPEGYGREYTIGKVAVKEVSLPGSYFDGTKLMWKPANVELWKVGHSFGMLQSINSASNSVIYMCDPDIIFYETVDQIYMDLMAKHDLKFIGAAHHIAINYSCKYFPNIVNIMTKKEYLPTPGFFKGRISATNVLKAIHSVQFPPEIDAAFENNYLCQGSQDNIMESYPNPKGISDTGSLLYYWNESIKGRWLSFMTPDCHNYAMTYYRNNFNLKEKFPNTKLFYHATSGADARFPYWEDFERIYEENK